MDLGGELVKRGTFAVAAMYARREREEWRIISFFNRFSVYGLNERDIASY